MGALAYKADTDSLVRELAAKTGETEAKALHTAVAERLEKLRSPEHREFIRRIREITDRVAEMPCLDPRTDDEIIGYNEHGHFD